MTNLTAHQRSLLTTLVGDRRTHLHRILDNHHLPRASQTEIATTITELDDIVVTLGHRTSEKGTTS